MCTLNLFYFAVSLIINIVANLVISIKPVVLFLNLLFDLLHKGFFIHFESMNQKRDLKFILYEIGISFGNVPNPVESLPKSKIEK